MASCKILFFSVLVSFLCFGIIKAQDIPTYVGNDCSTNVTTSNSSTFQTNLMTLLSSLSSKANGNTQFYNTTITSIPPSASEAVYGLFMCRGDVLSQLCNECIVDATKQLPLKCPLSKEAVIWYEECMVRYSNLSFFSTFEETDAYRYWNDNDVSNPDSFKNLLSSTMNQTADEAASGDKNKKFATIKRPVSKFQTLYCLAQCTPDLLPNDCRRCLTNAIEIIPQCCDGKQGAKVFFPSCNIRYELFPFYRSTNSSNDALIPEINDSKQDSTFSQDPVYLSHNCSSTITNDNTFEINKKFLFSYLSSNATRKPFHQVDLQEVLYGLYMCRGDIPSYLCGQCVKNATDRIYSTCSSSPKGIIWYSHCMLRYSTRYFSSTIETSPMYRDINITKSPVDQNLFAYKLSNLLSKLAIDTRDSNEKYMTRSIKLNHAQNLYTLEQCIRDLSSFDCASCLNDVITTTIPWNFLGSVGGRVLYPSCNLRFELYKFYMDSDEAQSPHSLSLSSGDAGELSLLK